VREPHRYYWYALGYLAVFAASTVAGGLERYTELSLGLRWREWLTRNIVHKYLSGQAYYRVNCKQGLGPLLPLFDHLLTTLVDDLEQRGRLDDVLVVAMGEFGRTPQLGTQGSTDGRDHWPFVMSLCLAGGGLRHGQVIGSTEKDGGQIATRPVTPADLAATIYRHVDVPLDAEYLDPTGRPVPIVYNGKPVAELF
jgi:hypothetical protein